MKNTKVFYVVSLGLLVICIIALVWQHRQIPKIGFVRTGYLVEEYIGMKEAIATHEKEVAQWQRNVDTLEVSLKNTIQQFQYEADKLPETVYKERVVYIEKQKEALERYRRATQEKIASSEEAVLATQLEEINAFIEAYGKEHHYDVILGTTSSGSLLYGNEQNDISEKLLEALNASYKK